MNPETETRILGPGQFETPAGQIRFMLPAGRDVFARRAGRFRALSGSHALGDYFLFLASLAEAQQKILDQFPAIHLPGAGEQAIRRELGEPLLDYRTLQRNPAWRRGLAMVLEQMKGAALPPAAGGAVAGLVRAGEAELEQKAAGILAGDLVKISSPGELPFIGAALQVYWVNMALSLPEDAFGRTRQAGLCPVCGSYPIGGVIEASGDRLGLRYLSCPLCACQWHMVRLKCSNCEATGGISYYIIDGSNGAVKAESCGDCKAYLKLFYIGKDPQMEPMADDLATIALDMLMAREGRARGGLNLYFHPGDSAPE